MRNLNDSIIYTGFVIILCALFIGYGGAMLKNSTLSPPHDHTELLKDFEAYVMIEGVKHILTPVPVKVHLEPQGNDKTTYLLEINDIAEGSLVINTWKTLEPGQFGYHSVEVARLGWGELNIDFRNVHVIFPVITDSVGMKIGYWSIPTY